MSPTVPHTCESCGESFGYNFMSNRGWCLDCEAQFARVQSQAEARRRVAQTMLGVRDVSAVTKHHFDRKRASSGEDES